jgi:ornithine decarboxylase
MIPDMPSADVLLRIRADDASARCQLGNKYGCEPGEDAVAMLRAAREFQLNVTGVSFHVVSRTAKFNPPAVRLHEVSPLCTESGYLWRVLC